MKPYHSENLSGSVSAAGSSTAPVQAVLVDKVPPHKRAKQVIGTSNTSSTTIKAAKEITPKAIFCVSNLNPNISCDVIKQFII